MEAIEIKDILVSECEKFNSYLTTHGGGYITTDVLSEKRDMCVMGFRVSIPDSPSNYESVGFLGFIHEDQIQYYMSLAKVNESQVGYAFHLINDINSSFPDYKFVYSENENGPDEIEMKYYIDTNYIREPNDWARLAFAFGHRLDLCRAEYKKAWEHLGAL